MHVTPISAVAAIGLLTSPAAAQDNWVTVSSEGFSVEMPELPDVGPGTLLPGAISARDYTVQLPEMGFRVTAYLLDAEDEQQASLDFRDGAEGLLSEGCQPETPSPLDLGAGVVAQCDETFYRLQFFVKDEHAYQVTVGGPREALDMPTAERFFSSFDLPDEPEWQETFSETDAFQVDFPGVPMIEELDFHEGSFFDAVAYSVRLQRGTLRVSVMSFLPEVRAAASDEQVLDYAATPVRTNCTDAELTDFETVLGAGRQAEAICGGEIYRARHIVVGERLFDVSATGPDGFAASKPALRFLNSFSPISFQ